MTETAELRTELEMLIPLYTAALTGLSGKIEEFDNRGCASWIDGLVERVRLEYQRWEAAGQRADIVTMLFTAAANLALMAGRYQPLPQTATPVVAVAILPGREIRPALPSEFAGRKDVPLLTWKEFEAAAGKLKSLDLQKP